MAYGEPFVFFGLHVVPQMADPQRVAVSDRKLPVFRWFGIDGNPPIVLSQPPDDRLLALPAGPRPLATPPTLFLASDLPPHPPWVTVGASYLCPLTKQDDLTVPKEAVPAACPIGRSPLGDHGHSRAA